MQNQTPVYNRMGDEKVVPLEGDRVPVSEQDLVGLRRLAIEIASKHDQGYVVGVSTLIHKANAIRVYIVTGGLPVVVTGYPLHGGS